MKGFAAYWIENFQTNRIKDFDKRYVTLDDLEPLFKSLSSTMAVAELGVSFENRPIKMISIGSGKKNVLAWSCMHGNETTCLRGWMDWVVYQNDTVGEKYFSKLLQEFTIHYIPMLNPDGALRYTRRNAMGLDMNRDARALESPEMKLLIAEIDRLKPVLAFNLHDQRNIFAVNNVSATISFLAPSVDISRTIDESRERTMDLIGAAVNAIEPYLKKGIGRYTDEFYPTAVGEYVHQLGIPTILIECGAAKNDPLRQLARMLNPIILYAVLNRLFLNELPETTVYKALPLNETNQVDIVIRKVKVQKNGKSFVADIALLADHSLEDGKLNSKYKINDFGDLNQLIGLEEFDFNEEAVSIHINVGELASFSLLTNKGELTFVNGIKENARFN